MNKERVFTECIQGRASELLESFPVVEHGKDGQPNKCQNEGNNEDNRHNLSN